MRVLEINKFHFNHGGADKYYLEVSDALKAAGHTVAHFSMRHPENRASNYEKYFVSEVDFSFSGNSFKKLTNTLKVVGRIFWSFEAARNIEKLITAFKPDIAHIHTIYHQLSPSILSVLKKHNIPVVMTVHDFGLISCNYVRYHDDAICSHTIDGKYWKAVFHKCVKNSYVASALEAAAFYFHRSIGVYEKHIDHFIFPSTFHQTEHIKAGFSMKNHNVLANYIDTKNLVPQYEIGEYILVVGRLFKEKGADLALKAYAQSNIRLPLVIMGNGPLETELKNQVTEYGLENRVTIEPFLGDDNQHERIKNAAFVINPSRALENQPIAILESMALGKTVIASNTGGVSDIIENGVDGILFERENVTDLKEKIESAAVQLSECINRGIKARLKIENTFNKQVHLDALELLFSQLTKTNN